MTAADRVAPEPAGSQAGDAGRPLLAAPNVSEGRDREAVEAIAAALTATGARLLDVHSDPDHNRSVLTVAGRPGQLASAMVSCARETLARIDMRSHRGAHPCVGALDVAPFVHLGSSERGAACAEALVAGDELARELDLPVFLYGALAGGRARAELRRGGIAELAARMRSGELAPDFGPGEPHPAGGATLVAARPPLVAFNVELEPPADRETARRIAALVREGGEGGLPGVRAIGLWLDARATAQVSCNVEDPDRTPLAAVVDAVGRHARVGTAELVGLAPRAALDGFPDGVPIRGFDRSRQVIENALLGFS